MGFCHKDVWVCGAAHRSCLVISVFSDTKWPIPAKAWAEIRTACTWPREIAPWRRAVVKPKDMDVVQNRSNGEGRAGTE